MDFKDLRVPNASSWAQIEKLALARKVGVFLSEGQKPDRERRVVENVAQTLANDLSLEVRQTLAFELRRANHLPRDLAEHIARDAEEVSGQFLMHTEVFSPEDLAALARELEEHARIAIARRPTVPEVVSVAIADVGGERSVTYLIRNPGADLATASERIVNRFAHHGSILESLCERADLPLHVIHRLVDRVSEANRAALAERYGLDDETAQSLSGAAGGAQLAKWVQTASRGSLNDYIHQLESRGALTDRLLADVTRRGGYRFFESVMAHATGIDLVNIERIVREGSKAHLAKLLQKAGYRDDRGRRLLAAVIECGIRDGAHGGDAKDAQNDREGGQGAG